MRKILEFILERLGEKSTVITLATFVTGLIGTTLLPEQADAIAVAVVGVVGAVAVFTKEEK